MSAPPIGMIISTPSASARSVTIRKSKPPPVSTRRMTKKTSATASAMLIRWRAGRMIGAPLIRADSLRNAITEPVKVSAPMATPSDISTRLCGWMLPAVPMSKASGAKKAPAATSTAAMPTSEWKAATSSGIAVIGTRRAMTAPMPPPIATPRITRIQASASAGGWLASVVRTAIPMPTMPNRLPWRLVAGLDSPRSDRMNSTPATR